MKITSDLKDISGIKALLEKGAEIYIVGGVVRDFYLKKESKDIDLVVRLLEIDEIESILKKHGTVKEVGKSFGILKYRPLNWESEDIDIALPRRERKKINGKGHQDFDVFPDHLMKIEEELERRDFTINSIAINIVTEEVIDPFNGISDIKNKIIKAIYSSKTFIDDPLRILRAIQFASRFNFVIDKSTFMLIKENAGLIDEISPERIVIELDKIFYKGDKLEGYKLLLSSGVLKYILKEFNKDIKSFDRKVKNIEFLLNLTRGDFYYLLLEVKDDPYTFFIKELKGDLETGRFIKALTHLRDAVINRKDIFAKRLLLCEMVKICKNIKESGLIFTHNFLGDDIRIDLKYKRFVTSISELAVKGDDIKEILKIEDGIEIGNILKKMFLDVLYEVKINDKNDLFYSTILYKRILDKIEQKANSQYDRDSFYIRKSIRIELSLWDRESKDDIKIKAIHSSHNKEEEIFEMSLSALKRKVKINNIMKTIQ